MDINSVLRQQLKDAHGWLDATLQGVTADQLHWKPPGKANTIGASYAHVVLSEDMVVNTMLKGGKPMCATSWAGKTGLSEVPSNPEQSWFDWGRRVKVDLPALQKYAQAVQANSDAYIASLKEADLERKVASPLGTMSVLAIVSNFVTGHVHDFAGEVSCLKGLQGLKGYPA